MESAAGELIQSHPQPITGIGDSSEDHGSLVPNSICSVPSSPFNFPSSKDTLLSSSSKDSGQDLPRLSSSALRDLPKLISKENYLHFTGLTSQPHPVIVESKQTLFILSKC